MRRFNDIYSHGDTRLAQPVASSATVTVECGDYTSDFLLPQSTSSRSGDSLFVADLNPEGMFLAATSPPTNKQTTDLGNVGVWLSQRPIEDVIHTYDRSVLEDNLSSSIFAFDPAIGRLFLPSLREKCLSTLPPAADLAALFELYFRRINPILPLIDEEFFRMMERSQAETVLLSQGICTAASASPDAFNHLRLSSPVTALTQLAFTRAISGAMRTSLELGLVTDKFVIIQAYTLLSLFMQAHDLGDIAAQMSGRAVHYLHTIGLHHGRRTISHMDAREETLFCSVWALDRLNGAFHGRPLLMHERDIGRDMKQCFQRQVPLFRLLLRIVQILDQIIALYRPKHRDAPSIAPAEIPDFEDIILESGAGREDSSLLGMADSSLILIYTPS